MPCRARSYAREERMDVRNGRRWHAPRTFMLFTRHSFIVFAALLVAAGCGKTGGLDRGAVEGRVTLDGQEIVEGSIIFTPTGDTKGMVAGGIIQNGHYQIAASRGPVVGKNRVAIHASRKTGHKVQSAMAEPGTMTDEIVEAVPLRYNANSTLDRDIAAGKNTLDFELTTQ